MTRKEKEEEGMDTSATNMWLLLGEREKMIVNMTHI